ncbi:GH36-type glycosyl hydrolase domain-containing protein [Aquimonas sp.]|jgi:cellobionic acid phosphorylase|uniref:GH36-type glycosyl hydrolase domain-containing protein n=1 Tax=Aquimonas sp. TaxID=1872588 RepID=UPI0037C0EBE0
MDLIRQHGAAVELNCPRSMPRASTFLWNRALFLQLNCRGYASALHLQPEPGKYAYAPTLEAKSFLQPEQPHYAHHPGRFVYIKDEDSGAVFSLPYEPTRVRTDSFCFRAEPDQASWLIEHLGLALSWSVSLPVEDAVELWQLRIDNRSGQRRRLSVYLYFPIGYMSWMNQSARYEPVLGGIVARCITGYQKLEDYAQIRRLKDHSYLLHDTAPQSWECRQEAFEGEGGLISPDGVRAAQLQNGEALYQTPAACLHYRLELGDDDTRELRFAFGPALNHSEIKAVRERYLVPQGFEQARAGYRDFLAPALDAVQINTPDYGLDAFANSWLNRQAFYLGHANRFTTDPQTRNYLQDAMGVAYLQPALARAALLRCLSQQEPDGALPDGILLHAEAQLKYINQIPHTDHGVWLPLSLQVYLDESGDYGLLQVPVTDRHGSTRTVSERVLAALRWLLDNRDARGLSYMGQGDWCDPMNMVGHLGRGVSGWLSIATVYALRSWAQVCLQHGQADTAAELKTAAAELDRCVQEHLWDGDWFARGITDHGRRFGVRADDEGRIFLNPQSFAILAGIATPEQQQRMHAAIAQQLQSPFGLALCEPPYTRMHEDIGRVTQKFPGAAENGSIYNHAGAFYIHALYASGEGERAFALLRQMIPGPDPADYLQRGQLPTFLPNYYRGAHRLHSQTAGRSSQLANTGTAGWIQRALIEGLFGLRGCRDGLMIQPQLPLCWPTAHLRRRFRGAEFDIHYSRGGSELQLSLDGQNLATPLIRAIEPGRRYSVYVQVPSA